MGRFRPEPLGSAEQQAAFVRTGVMHFGDCIPIGPATPSCGSFGVVALYDRDVNCRRCLLRMISDKFNARRSSFDQTILGQRLKRAALREVAAYFRELDRVRK